ncbi:hypothetical protein [uncultured Mitsuokella sp.]|uniref:hypothetical protein n=1 Tax=uncultured Mitsuokella sp. TaxID=453120 RepID=UPI0025E5EE97|nr:hypothetical protein [uncultured Mitsuokella sp.]
MLERYRKDLPGLLMSLLVLVGLVYAWLCFTCVLRQGHVPEEDYVRMTQELGKDSVKEGPLPAAWDYEKNLQETQP